MRGSRTFLASAGASMSLVAAAVSALFVVSAVIAVQGWPGVDPEDDVPALVLSDVPLPSAPAPDTATTASAPGTPDAATPIVLAGGPTPATAGDGDGAGTGTGTGTGDGPGTGTGDSTGGPAAGGPAAPGGTPVDGT